MKVRIYKPSKSAMQSGHGKAKQWLIECVLPTARTPEPLMGWVSSGDTLNQLKLRFDTAEDAIQHAEEQGWEYSLQSSQARRVKPRNYGQNFVYTQPVEE